MTCVFTTSAAVAARRWSCCTAVALPCTTSIEWPRWTFVDLANTDQPDRSTEIPRISVPTLVLRSASIDGQHFARDIADSRELIHPDGGHLLPEEQPEWVAEAVADFLDARAAGDRADDAR